MRFRLRTLLIVATFAPAALAVIVLGFAYSDPARWADFVVGLMTALFTFVAWTVHRLKKVASEDSTSKPNHA
jgi:hypothetical protein